MARVRPVRPPQCLRRVPAGIDPAPPRHVRPHVGGEAAIPAARGEVDAHGAHDGPPRRVRRAGDEELRVGALLAGGHGGGGRLQEAGSEGDGYLMLCTSK